MILINEQQIRSRIPASANIEMSLLRPNILLYQETRLVEIMGWSFYNDFVTKYGNQTLNSDEQALLLIIHPTISYGGLMTTIPYIWSQISNRGIIQQNGDFTNPSSDSAFRLMRDNLKTSVDHYERRLLKYLEVNKGLFPLWKYINTDLQSPETQVPNDFGFILDYFKNEECDGCKKNNFL